MQRIKVGFLSSQNYLNRQSWSGILYRMHHALNSTDLQIINLGNPQKTNRFNTYMGKVLKRIAKKKQSLPIGSPEFIDKNNKFISLVDKQLKKTPCDVIFAPVASGEVSFIETSIPLIYLSDIPTKLYYKSYSLNLSQQEFSFKEKLESTAISKASKLVYPSDWAANSAMADYQVKADKIEVIPFGANLDDPPSKEEVIYSKKYSSPCRLLFIGVDWQRKGGDIAVQTLIALNKMGIESELTVVGSKAPAKVKHDRLTVIPFLDKNNVDHRKKFRELLWKSHFFLFPTRAEAFGVVSCEANAFGLPVITTEVGGVPTIIRNGKNGYMLPLSASGNDFAKLIAGIFSDKTRYEQLVCSSREEYDKRLNWNAWAEHLHQVIINMLG